MASVVTVSVEDDSEREEGEIVDDVDELSDISSEEEFLLRQRLQVLENYNHVLERKEAKRTSFGSGNTKRQNNNLFLEDLSEISGAELDDNFQSNNEKDKKQLKTYQKVKRRKDPGHVPVPKKEHKKKLKLRIKKKEVKIISESSDESADEYRNKRRKLANAVSIHISKNDPSSLKARLTKMLYVNQRPCDIKEVTNNLETAISENIDLSPISSNTNSPMPKADQENENLSKELTDEIVACQNLSNEILSQEILEDPTKISKLLDLCLESKDVSCKGKDTVDSVIKNKEESVETIKSDSDEDLELLRQHALKTKTTKLKTSDKHVSHETDKLESSEGEDSDTVELRMICLKSALLKRAIEMKQKQKLQKRLSQSSNLHDDIIAEQEELLDKIDSGNNTDIESVDMDIGSDGDEKTKDVEDVNKLEIVDETENISDIPGSKTTKVDEVEEDEDLLRANLLISLSKNLPNLVDPQFTDDSIKSVDTKVKPNSNVKNTKVAEEKKFIINLGDSDSEGEHEATKNLTKMHIKLSEQIDFQQKLDMFLKSTRMEVEKNTLPDVVQKPEQKVVQTSPLKSGEKFVPKAVRHLPKSEQIEYKNLVKRMAELEKIKQARQSSILLSNNSIPTKETLRARNVSIEKNRMPVIDIDQQIALSRKKIAEESVKVLRLKEEAKKLSQKYKIVSTELRNITTAITLNKKEQRAAQMRLSKVRAEHQVVLKSSTSLSNHSTTNAQILHNRFEKPTPVAKLQKENNPTKKNDYKIPQMQKSVKVSVVNDIVEEPVVTPILSVQLDLANNTKTVKIPKDRSSDNLCHFYSKNMLSVNEKDRLEVPVDEKGGGRNFRDADDYTSPLQALGEATWDADPNAILCPFEIGGHCKDVDCKYFHPKTPLEQ